MTNSSSPPPPKTSANWLRFFLHRSKRAKPDRKSARAVFGTAISALANVSFSTASAETGLSLHLRAKNAPSVEANIPTGTVFEFIASVRKAAPTPFYQFLCHDAGMQF
jgi:hypothetical protein